MYKKNYQNLINHACRDLCQG